MLMNKYLITKNRSAWSKKIYATDNNAAITSMSNNYGDNWRAQGYRIYQLIEIGE